MYRLAARTACATAPGSAALMCPAVAQDRLDVHDRRAVDGLQVADAHPRASTATTSTGCRPIGFGRSAERVAKTPVQRIGGIVARVHAQHVAVRAVQPGEHDHLGARLDALEAVEHGRLEHQPGVGRPLATLLGRRRRVGQLGLDPSDRRSSITPRPRPARRRGSASRRQASRRSGAARSTSLSSANMRLPPPSTVGKTISRYSSTRSLARSVVDQLGAAVDEHVAAGLLAQLRHRVDELVGPDDRRVVPLGRPSSPRRRTCACR